MEGPFGGGGMENMGRFGSGMNMGRMSGEDLVAIVFRLQSSVLRWKTQFDAKQYFPQKKLLVKPFSTSTLPLNQQRLCKHRHILDLLNESGNAM